MPHSEPFEPAQMKLISPYEDIPTQCPFQAQGYDWGSLTAVSAICIVISGPYIDLF